MQKIVKLNRALLYCCMVVLFSLYFKSYAAPTQGKPVSLTIKNSSLAEVLRQVSKKSGLYIYFQDADLAAHKNVTIDVRNKPVESVLHELLDERGFSWVEVGENTIAVKKKPVPDLERKIEGDTVSMITVTGKVINEKSEPISGVSIMVKGTTRGTVTDINGAFEIAGVGLNSMLVLTNVAYMGKEINVKTLRNIGTIILKDYVDLLDETIVVAYGTTTKRVNIGNVVSIKSADIERQPINNPLLALQGRVAGLIVTPTTGLPGGEVNLQIRGNNSLAFRTSPLIVIDGLPLVNNVPSLGGSYFQLSSLGFINPHDIESIDILKDADATSIYGSRGANGVILITTKKGKQGQTKIDLNVQSGFGRVPKHVKLLGTNDFIKLRKQAYANSGIDFINTFPYNTPAEYKYLFAPDLFVWKQNEQTDWQKVLIGGTSKYTDVQGSISGGAAIVQYLIGGNFHRETTVFPGNNDDKKGNVHISLTGTSVDQKFKATISASYMVDHNTLPGIDFTNKALTLAPNSPALHKDDGTLNWAPLPNGASSWANPLAELEKIYDAKINNLVSSADLSYRPLSFLTLKTQVGYSLLNGNAFISNGTLASTPPERINPNLIFGSNFNSNSIRNLNIEPQLNLNFAMGRGVLQGLVGASIQNTRIEDQRLSAVGFKSDAQIRNLASAASLTGNNTSSQYRYSAIFARLNYNWQNKYLVNLTARRDGSSRFGPGNQFGNFGSLGIGWIFSEEQFFSKRLPLLSFGKLRLSYGTAGNDGISDYAYFERYDPILGVDSYQGASGLNTTGIFNSYYHWETTKKMEAGLETGFAKDRLMFSVSFFRNRSNNQLLNTTYPSTVGPGTAVINLPALIQNSGYELTLSSVNIKTKNITWQTSANFTANRNKLLSFPNLEESNYYASFEIGAPFYGIERTFKQAGVDPQTGRYQFTDLKGATVVDPNDEARIDGGRYLRVMTAPKFYGGLSNTLTWKGLSLDLFLQFVKQKGINFLNSYYQTAGLAPTNLPVEFLSSWQKVGDVTNIQKLTGVRDNDLSRSTTWYQSSDATYVDASFIRLKNLALSYSMPKKMSERMRLQSLRLYIQGQNIFTITKYKGLDPETQSANTLPPLRMLVTGIQISL